MAIYAQTPRWCLLDNKNAELSFPCDEDETEVPCLTGTTAAVIYFQMLDDRRKYIYTSGGKIHWNPYG